jgi:hypothetical protein
MTSYLFSGVMLRTVGLVLVLYLLAYFLTFVQPVVRTYIQHVLTGKYVPGMIQYQLLIMVVVEW